MQINIVPPPPPTLFSTALPDGVLNVPYSGTPQAIGGATPLNWTVTAGSLPTGLALNASTGQITGTPTSTDADPITPGDQPFVFTLEVKDAMGRTDSQPFTVAIGNPVPFVERVSVAFDESQANGDSGTPSVSPDGRFIAFTSFATNLVPGDTNNVTDVFVRLRDPDPTCATTVRVSVASDGTQGNNNSFSPAISGLNGNTIFVAYVSEASNLVANDANNNRDIFVTAVEVDGCALTPVSTVRASVSTGGTEANSSSALPSISVDGLRVAYHCFASNLVDADSNGQADIFVTDLQFSGGVLSVVRAQRADIVRARVSISVGDTTADIFSSTTIGRTTLMMTPNEHVGRLAEIGAGTAQGQERTIIANDATTITVDPAWNPVPDGTSIFRVITLEDLLADIFSDTTLGRMDLTMRASEFADEPVEILAGTGAGQTRRVVSNTATTLTVDPAWNPVPDDTSVFRLLNEAAAGATRAKLTADGAEVAFNSDSIFDRSDTNNASDAFARDLASEAITRVSLDSFGVQGNGLTLVSAISGQGRFVLFQSFSNCLLEALPDTPADIFSSTTIGNSTLTMTTDEHVGRIAFISSGTGVGQFRNITANNATTLTVDTAWITTPNNTSVFRVCSDTNSTSDLFLRDRTAAATLRVSLANDGSQANGGADPVAGMSGGGRLIAFSTSASNLVAGDTNSARDIYLRDIGDPDNPSDDTTARLSLALGGTNPNSECFDPSISLDGSTVAFTTAASNLLPDGPDPDTLLDDTNGVPDIYVASTGLTDLVLMIAPRFSAGRQGEPFSGALVGLGGTGSLFWAVADGSLPPGLSLNPRTSAITGIPQKAGRFQFTVVAMDGARPVRTARRTMTLTVYPAAAPSKTQP